MTDILNLDGQVLTSEPSTEKKEEQPNQPLNGIFYGRVWSWHLQIIQMQRADDILLQMHSVSKFIFDFYQKYGGRIETMQTRLNEIREECCEKRNGEYQFTVDAQGNRDALYKSDELKDKYTKLVNELFSQPANL